MRLIAGRGAMFAVISDSSGEERAAKPQSKALNILADQCFILTYELLTVL